MVNHPSRTRAANERRATSEYLNKPLRTLTETQRALDERHTALFDTVCRNALLGLHARHIHFTYFGPEKTRDWHWKAEAFIQQGRTRDHADAQGLLARDDWTFPKLTEALERLGDQPIARGIGKTPLEALYALQPVPWKL